MHAPIAQLRLQLFGRARIAVGGEDLELAAPPRTLPLLAYIVLARRPIERSVVAAALWPDRSDDEALANVRRHLHALHRNLRAAGVQKNLVITENGCLRLDSDVSIVTDVLEFDRLVRDDVTQADAVTLYRGDLLEAFDDAWIAPERDRLRATQCRTLAHLCEIARSRGDGEDALHFIHRALALETWNEDLARAALFLHWEFDDRAGAQRTYHTYVERLRGDLDEAPNTAIRQLAERIASGAPYGRPGSWPAELDLTTFFGRADEIERLSSIAAERRAVVLTGPPGVGKTRLALRVARRLEPQFPDGMWFVDISVVARGTSIEPAIVEALCKGGEAKHDSVREMLAGKRLVLVIDNCEHVSREATDAIERISSLSRNVLIIATSRRVLDIRGAAIWSVRPLPVPGAGVELFIDRARAAVADGDGAHLSSPAAIDLCAQLDGLPLALELAAARLRSIPFEELATRLGERFELLASDDDRAGRSGALRTTFDWSYSLLSETEQRFFHCLATFVGGWTVSAAAFVAEVDEWRALRLLAQLIDKSFVIAPSSGASTTRYDMLQSLREYALIASDEERLQHMRQRHAAYYASLWLDDDQADAFAVERREDYSAIALEFDNVRAALRVLLAERYDPARGVELVCALGFFWVDSVPWLEGKEWLDAALEARAGATRQHAELRVLKSRLALRRGNAAEAYAEADLAVNLTSVPGEDLVRARALMARSRAAWMRTELASSRSDAEGALEICIAAGSVYGRARALSTLYLPLISAGDVDRANDAVTTAAELYRSLNAQVELAEAHANIGTCAYYQSDIALAAEHYRKALALIRDTKNDRTIAFIAHNLASVAWECGDAVEAWLQIAFAMSTAMRIGYPAIIVRSVELVARWCVARDPYDAAVFSAAAAAESERHDARFQEVEREDHERLGAAIVAALTAPVIAQARTEASVLSLAEVAQRAIDYADRARVAAIEDGFAITSR